MCPKLEKSPVETGFNTCVYILIFLQNMIDVSLTTNIQDASVYQFPLDLVSDLLQQVMMSSNL